MRMIVWLIYLHKCRNKCERLPSGHALVNVAQRLLSSLCRGAVRKRGGRHKGALSARNNGNAYSECDVRSLRLQMPVASENRLAPKRRVTKERSSTTERYLNELTYTRIRDGRFRSNKQKGSAQLRSSLLQFPGNDYEF